MTNTNTEAKTATNGGSVSTTATLNNKLAIIRRASERLQEDMIGCDGLTIIERVSTLGASLSFLTLSIQRGEVEAINLPKFIGDVMELPQFIEDLCKVVGDVQSLIHTIELSTAE